jgi:serine/threonine protein kinase
LGGTYRRLFASAITALLLCLTLPSQAGRVVSGASGQTYELGRRVGAGGFGKVYRAWKVTGMRNGKPVRGQGVAIKQYDSLAHVLFEDLGHKAVAGIKGLPQTLDDGFDGHSGKNFLVMPWVKGRTLDQWNKDAKPTVEARVEAVVRACRLIAEAHDRGELLHLDLKPSNIMVDGHGNVSVLDLGISQAKGADGKALGEGAGTKGFMPPEQSQAAEIDDRTDVFALAGTLYQLLTRTNPVRKTGQIGVHIDRIKDPQLRGIIAKGLAENPADRYASAEKLGAALRRWGDKR